jgi:hypothetical protein
MADSVEKLFLPFRRATLIHQRWVARAIEIQNDLRIGSNIALPIHLADFSTESTHS